MARSDQLCSVDPEHGPVVARGWCRLCYQRWWRRGGDPSDRLVRNVGKDCSIHPEHGPAYSRGWCYKCYARWRRHGDPTFVPDKFVPLEQRLRYRVDKKTGCWIWLGSRNKKTGYGVVRVESRAVKAHRASYELFVGPIPDGLYLDHLCGNPSCINPEHLEPVTMSQNNRRGGEPHFELRGTA